MDKYEYNLKLDQMKSLFAEEKYEEAAELADTVNWNKVKNPSALLRAGEIYEKAGRYESSHNVLLLAYDRAPIGRAIIYRLAEVAIRMEDYQAAQDYYDEFVEIAPHDNMKYVLRYDIRKAQGAPYSELIPILQEFKEQEYTEEWAYELAYLYHKAGMIDKCIEACDELSVWFGDGPYVERALELKMLYQPLDKKQEDKYRALKQAKEGYTHIGVDDFKRGGESGGHEPVAIPQVEVNAERYNTVNLQEEIARGMQQIMDATEKKEIADSLDNINKMVEDIPYLKLPRENVEETVHIETDEEIDGSLKINFQELLGEEYDGQMSLRVDEQAQVERQITGQITIAEVLEEWERTKRAAEAAMQEAEQRKLESAKARALQQAGDIMERLNDVMPKLDAGVTPRELLEEEYLKEQPQQAETAAVVQEREELAEMPGGAVLEEPDEGGTMPVRERAVSEAELPEGAGLASELPEGAGLASELPGEPGLEAGLSEEAVSDAGLSERIVPETGQAGVPGVEAELPEGAGIESELPEEPGVGSGQSEGAAPEAEQPEGAGSEAEQPGKKPVGKTKVVEADLEVLEIPKPKEGEDAKPKAAEQTKDLKADKKSPAEKGKTERWKLKTMRMPKFLEPKDLGAVDSGPIEELTDEQKKIFSYFIPVKGMESQLCKALSGVSRHLTKDTTAATGNLIIQGGQASGKTTLATSIIKVLQQETGHPNEKIGKIHAEVLNTKDVGPLLRKVAGGCLIIEQAGELDRQTIVALSLLLEQDSSGILVILEDTTKGIKKALAQDENFAKKFTEKITVPIFNNDQLVAFAKAYSKELGYEIDEMAVLALYKRISNIQRTDQATTLTEVKEIVDEAIEREAHGGVKKFFSILTASRYTDDDCIVLTEKDFE